MIQNTAMNHKNITIIGFGNQASAWADNLVDSGWNVSIALRSNSPKINSINSQRFNLIEMNNITDSLVALLTPDHTHGDILNSITLPKDTAVIYAHGYSIKSYKLNEKFLQYSHILLAPKAIGAKVRENYIKNIALAGVYSFEHAKEDFNTDQIKILSHDLGIRAFFPCTIVQEVTADLFSEQSLLCSLIPYAAKESFNRLLDRGIPEELAYFECWHELKLIVDTMVDLGPQKFFDKISPNALLGADKGQKSLINDDFNNKLETLLNEIEDGKFYKEIDNSNFDTLQKNMSDAWSLERLQKTHERISPLLTGVYK